MTDKIKFNISYFRDLNRNIYEHTLRKIREEIDTPKLGAYSVHKDFLESYLKLLEIALSIQEAKDLLLSALERYAKYTDHKWNEGGLKLTSIPMTFAEMEMAKLSKEAQRLFDKNEPRTTVQPYTDLISAAEKVLQRKIGAINKPGLNQAEIDNLLELDPHDQTFVRKSLKAQQERRAKVATVFAKADKIRSENTVIMTQKELDSLLEKAKDQGKNGK